jgi:hypothetical protein
VEPLPATLAQTEFLQSHLQRVHGSKDWKPIILCYSPQIELSEVLQLVKSLKVFSNDASAPKEVDILKKWQP